MYAVPVWKSDQFLLLLLLHLFSNGEAMFAPGALNDERGEGQPDSLLFFDLSHMIVTFAQEL